MNDMLQSRVESQLQEIIGSGLAVSDLVQLTGGASRQMWLVQTRGASGGKSFILRMDHPSDPDPMANSREARVLERARQNGVAAPDVLTWSSDPAVLGTPYILLSFVEGETIARKILRDDRYAHAREVLPRQLGEAAGQIIQVDVSDMELGPERDPIADLTASYTSVEIDRPALLLGLRELDRERPAPAPRSGLVHGDFRLGNLMVDDNGLAAVLDWELVHRGDPYEDLGYLCMRAWRFGGSRRVAGIGDTDELLDGYRSVAGFSPTEEQLTWWQARATLWWGIGCLRQMQRSVPGHTSELELLAIGRRTAEQEHDLLGLLYPDVPAAAGPDTAVSARADSPTLFSSPWAEALFAGLENHLTARLEEETNSSARFSTRIAKNVVSVLKREQSMKVSSDRWYSQSLQRLGVETEAQLCEQIHALPETSDSSAEVREIVAVLKTASRLRLAASNPHYEGS